MPSLTSDASRCPLCGQANQCAVAAGLPAQSCWCMQASIPATVLEQIPVAQRGSICVCPACGQNMSPATSPS